VRLLGINSPESVDPRRTVECFGKEASNYAKENFLGKNVIVKTDNTQSMYDKYNRLLAYVYLYNSSSTIGEMINERLIRDGYAYEYTYDKPYTYQVDFKALQSAAQSDGAGLWSVNTCNGKK
jgi:micrococcal nuclease